MQDGKYRIYLQFQQNASAKENAGFLKKEYGTGGRYPVLVGTHIDEWHDGKGITLTREKITGPDTKIILPWTKVQKRIGELIAADRYLNNKEKEHLSTYRQQMEERRQQFADEAYAREILNREPAPAEPEPPSRENAQYAVSLGDTVYLGADEYEIISFDDSTVQFRYVNFPLFNKELARSDFERMVRENPLNDHLIAAEQESPVTQTEAPDKPAKEKTEKPLTRALYREYLPQVVGRVRTDEINPTCETEIPIPTVPSRSWTRPLTALFFLCAKNTRSFTKPMPLCPSFGNGSRRTCSSEPIRII